MVGLYEQEIEVCPAGRFLYSANLLAARWKGRGVHAPESLPHGRESLLANQQGHILGYLLEIQLTGLCWCNMDSSTTLKAMAQGYSSLEQRQTQLGSHPRSKSQIKNGTSVADHDTTRLTAEA